MFPFCTCGPFSNCIFKLDAPWTHLLFNVCPQRSHFENVLEKNSHTCKKETNTVPHLQPNKHTSPSTHTAQREECVCGGVISQHSGDFCAVFVFGLFPSPSDP